MDNRVKKENGVLKCTVDDCKQTFSVTLYFLNHFHPFL